MRIARFDLVTATGSSQVCVGLEDGCEAAAHTMRNIFSHEDTEGTLLVDAANAFNDLNRKAALHSMSFFCPSLATVLSNTYQSPTRCSFLVGEKFRPVKTLIRMVLWGWPCTPCRLLFP